MPRDALPRAPYARPPGWLARAFAPPAALPGPSNDSACARAVPRSRPPAASSGSDKKANRPDRRESFRPQRLAISQARPLRFHEPRGQLGASVPPSTRAWQGSTSCASPSCSIGKLGVSGGVHPRRPRFWRFTGADQRRPSLIDRGSRRAGEQSALDGRCFCSLWRPARAMPRLLQHRRPRHCRRPRQCALSRWPRTSPWIRS
jgi:hypothetical protein